MKYDSRMKYKWDNENVMDYAVKQAKQEAKQEGEYAKATSVAREMKKDEMPVAQISKYTGVSIEEIEKL